ncbi:hypothetical protein [Planctomycetes bacterium K23_9]|uniref:Uncharacterized protein n=1 Tax=Stieleria marina TaxID=1930275 RepID=A0A517P2R0_9BACT|nr:hypothetical protein K239x_56770 [Planctomycetes bacterium K23_9]
MLPNPVLCVLVGALAANGILVIRLIRGILWDEVRAVSLKRRPPEDSQWRLIVQLTLLGMTLGHCVGWLLGSEDPTILVLVGIVSVCGGELYSLRHSRRLNLFYLNRARRLLDEGDLHGAGEDAREVLSSSQILRTDALAILKSTEQGRRFQPASSPASSLLSSTTSFTK